MIPYSSVIATLLALLVAGCERPPPAETGAQTPVPAVENPNNESNVESPEAPLSWSPAPVELNEEHAAAALTTARQASADGNLYAGPDAAIPLYLALRQHQRYHSAANTGLLRAAHALLAEGKEALTLAADDAKALNQAQSDAAVLRAIQPELEGIVSEAELAEISLFLATVDLATQVWKLNDEGERELQAGRLGEDGGGALARFRAAEELAPGQTRAREGLTAVEAGLIQRAEQAARADDFAAATRWLTHASKVREDQTAVANAVAHIEHLRNTRISRLRAQAAAGLGHYGGIQKAQKLLQHMQQIADAGDFVVADLDARIETAIHYGLFGPGQMFMEPLRDGGRGPQMAVIAYGRFQMGAIPGDPDAHPHEQPAHPVQFERGFAISVHEITVAEFARFIKSSGYQPRAVRRGFSMAYDERSGNFVRHSQVDWQSDYLGHPADACTSARTMPPPTLDGCPRKPARCIVCPARPSSNMSCAPAVPRFTRGRAPHRHRMQAISPVARTNPPVDAPGSMRFSVTAMAIGVRLRSANLRPMPGACTIWPAISASGWPTVGTTVIAGRRLTVRPGLIPAAAIR